MSDEEKIEVSTMEDVENLIHEETFDEWLEEINEVREGVLRGSEESRRYFLKREADTSSAALKELKKIDAIVQCHLDYDSVVHAAAIDRPRLRVFLANTDGGRWIRIGCLYHILQASVCHSASIEHIPLRLLEAGDGGEDTLDLNAARKANWSEIAGIEKGSGDEAVA